MSEKTTPNEWIFLNMEIRPEISIWAAATNTINKDNITKFIYRIDVPLTVSDFERCFAIINKCDIKNETLVSLAEIAPQWKPFVEKWETLTRLFIKNEFDVFLEILNDCRNKK